MLVKIRLQIIERSVPADVPVEFAINVTSRIADLGAPHLLARLDIACENCGTVRTNNRCMHSVPRPRIAVKYRVRIAYEVFDSRVFKQVLDSRLIRTFWKP